MTILFNAFFTILLIGSFLGYMTLAKRSIGLRREFIPAFVFSAVASMVYFCGLLGILLAGSIAIMMVGLLSFLIFSYKRIKEGISFKVPFSLFGFFWLLGCFFFFSLLLRSQLTHYDNFSHWGIVVKQMLSTNAFPTGQSSLIDFKNYPLGISSFIYYICRFAGKSESIMIVGQGLLIFSCFYAMFGIIREKKRFLLYAFLGLGCGALSFFNITIRINTLLVDFLLPIYTLAVFAVAFEYRQDPLRAFITALPMMALLTISKSTGIVFALIGFIVLFYMVLIYGKNLSKGKIVALGLITLSVAILPYLAWTWHMNTAFTTIENKFDLQNMPIPKTPDQIKEITSLFIRTSLDLSTRPVMGILSFNLIAIGGVLFNTFILKKKWNLWKALIALDLVVLVYYVGIWGLYVFSMPLDEALWLAGFERYASSIVVLFVGGLVLTATKDIENSFYYKIGDLADEQAFKDVVNKNRYQRGVLICLAIGMTLLISEYNGIASIIGDYNNSLVYKTKKITGDRWYTNGKEDDHKYLFYASDNESQVTNFYMQYVGRYLLYAPNVDGIVLFYEDNMDNLLADYDYLVVVESDFNQRYLLKKHYGVTGQEGIYKVDTTGKDLGLIFEGGE